MPRSSARTTLKVRQANLQASAFLRFHGYSGTRLHALRAFQERNGLRPTGRLTRATLAMMRQPRCAHPELAVPTYECQRRFRRSAHSHIRIVGAYSADPEVHADTSGTTLYERVHCRWSSTRLGFAFVGSPPHNVGSTAVDATRRACRTWASTGIVTLEERDDPNNAEIRILWTPGVSSDPSSPDPFYGPGDKIAVGYYPYPFLNELAGDLHFDSSERWATPQVAGAFDVETVALHELGHCLGLGHCSDESSIMWHVYKESQHALTAMDAAELRRKYSDYLT